MANARELRQNVPEASCSAPYDGPAQLRPTRGQHHQLIVEGGCASGRAGPVRPWSAPRDESRNGWRWLPAFPAAPALPRGPVPFSHSRLT